MECPICLEKITRKYANMICDHKICKNCMKEYLMRLIIDGSDLKCPIPNCGVFINPDSILSERVIKNAMYAKSEKMGYLEYLEKISLGNKHSNEFTKYQSLVDEHYSEEREMLTKAFSGKVANQCPKTECHGRIFENKCSICKCEICADCEELLHDGKCDPRILKTVQYIRAKRVPCPICKVRVEKNTGCDHMTCPVCDTHFSYRKGTVMRYGTKAKDILKEANIEVKVPGIGGIPEWAISTKSIPTKSPTVDNNFILPLNPIQKCIAEHRCSYNAFRKICCNCLDPPPKYKCTSCELRKNLKHISNN